MMCFSKFWSSKNVWVRKNFGLENSKDGKILFGPSLKFPYYILLLFSVSSFLSFYSRSNYSKYVGGWVENCMSWNKRKLSSIRC